jgi:oligoribonuclease NrnB/cAMP/cGMP phosphodiesterase (DHH superfamily)
MPSFSNGSTGEVGLRIVTRPDFDGIVCAALISDALGVNPPVYWVEPNELQKGLVVIRPGDILANLPYHPTCDLWFDHHSTNRIETPFKGLFREAPSAARNVFEYFQGRFSRSFEDLVYWADRIDAADFTQDEVLFPEKYDYVLLSMTVSAENVKDEAYWDKLVCLLRDNDRAGVMADADVNVHCRRVVRQNREYAEWLKRYTQIKGPVAVTDFRSLDRPPSGNRYLAYCLFPDCVVSVRIRYQDERKEIVVVNIGHSIFNPHCHVHVGRLLAEFGGGGHRGAASVRLQTKAAETHLPYILDILIRNQPY